MDTLDGNALAGLFAEVFGGEMTSAMVTCRTCGFTAAIAETVVYSRLPGAVVRCRDCAGLLMVITQVRGVNCVDMMGVDMMGVDMMGMALPDWLLHRSSEL